MAEGTEPIRQDIDTIRDSMTDKMEQIESKVRGSVDQVRDNVEHTVDSVKRSFDIKKQVDERPWMAMGVAVLTGYALGSLGGGGEDDHPMPVYRRGEPMRYYYQDSHYQDSHYQEQRDRRDRQDRDDRHSADDEQWERRRSYASPYQGMGEQRSHRQQGGMMSDIMGQFSGEMNTITTAAVSAAVSMLRDVIKQNLPQFKEEYERARQEREQHNKLMYGDGNSDEQERVRQEQNIRSEYVHGNNPSRDESARLSDRPIERQNELGSGYSGSSGSQSEMSDKDYSSSPSYKGKGSNI